MLKKIPRGRWSFLGPGSEKKWYGTYECKPDGSWNRSVEKMLDRILSSDIPLCHCLGKMTHKKQRSREDSNSLQRKYRKY